MLERIDLLINKIRREGDIEDINSIDDFTLVEYMNDAQRAIQKIIHNIESSNSLFVGSDIIDLAVGQLTYDLPDFQLGRTSISSVHTIDSGNRIIQTLRKIDYRERVIVFGYSIENNRIVLSSDPATGGGRRLLVRYNYRVPTLGLRWGKVSLVSGQDITLDIETNDVESQTEYVTVVDKKGTQIVRDLYIDSFSNGLLTVEGDLSSVTDEHYVVYGRDATTHSEIPEDCLNHFKLFVQRKALAHINSTKVSDTDVFTQSEREELAELFAKVNTDVEYPLLLDTDFLGY